MNAVHPFTREYAAHDDVDVCWFDNHNRERTDDQVEDWLIDDLVPIGAMVMYADPGAGKSMVVQQIIHHLAYGRPLGPWGRQLAGGHFIRVFDLESDAHMSRERSYSITPFGDLAEDGNPDRRDNYACYSSKVIPKPDREAWAVVASQPERHALYLEQLLQDAEETGYPIRLVVIDTLTKFVGPKPQRAAGNAYEYEAAVVDRLNRLALDHRCAIILIHHTNKAGEISGSQGIGGSATVTCRLRVTDRTDEELEQGVPASGVLVSTKVRIGAGFCYSVDQRPDGVWEFVDRPASEAEARGNARVVLSALASGPKTKAELASCGLGSSLRTTLTRMRKSGLIFTKYGKWHANRDDRRTVPGEADGTCMVCGGPMTRMDPGQTMHPGCVPPPDDDGGTGSGGGAGPVTPPDPGSGGGTPTGNVSQEGELQQTGNPAPEESCPVDEVEPTETQRVSGFRMLQESVDASRMKPVKRIPRDVREVEPWSLFTERMSGEHRWITPTEVDMDALVMVLDRRGSYPSAMSSVPIVANLPTHTGAMSELPAKTAGILQIPGFTWNELGIGHPLGRIGNDPGPWWITIPHYLMLVKLAAEGRVPAPVILDSWTGRGTAGLFTDFSKAAQTARLEALASGDEDRYADVKRTISVAIRGLWPKAARSPFWRPDWSVSVRAEAAVRHWLRADQARQAGATLLKLGSVDEVAMLQPESPTAPAPYLIGQRYGQVSVKEQGITFGEWVTRRGNRQR
jgi:hypothetical protein